MLERTDTEHAPWHIVRADDKRRARINCITHMLSQLPYEKSEFSEPKLPKRSENKAYDDVASIAGRRFVPDAN